MHGRLGVEVMPPVATCRMEHLPIICRVECLIVVDVPKHSDIHRILLEELLYWEVGIAVGVSLRAKVSIV